MTVKRFKSGRKHKTLKPVLTKRARRQAKKRFPKVKVHVLYSVRSAMDSKPILPVHVQRWLEEIDMQSQKMFHKNYSNLSGKQKSDVFNSMNESGRKESVH